MSAYLELCKCGHAVLYHGINGCDAEVERRLYIGQLPIVCSCMTFRTVSPAASLGDGQHE